MSTWNKISHRLHHISVSNRQSVRMKTPWMDVLLVYEAVQLYLPKTSQGSIPWCWNLVTKFWCLDYWHVALSYLCNTVFTCMLHKIQITSYSLSNICDLFKVLKIVIFSIIFFLFSVTMSNSNKLLSDNQTTPPYHWIRTNSGSVDNFSYWFYHLLTVYSRIHKI